MKFYMHIIVLSSMMVLENLTWVYIILFDLHKGENQYDLAFL